MLYATHDSLGLIPFVDLARRAGVSDTLVFNACTRNTGAIATITKATEDVEKMGGTGTPTIVVNGILIRRGIDSAYVAGVLKDLEKR